MTPRPWTPGTGQLLAIKLALIGAALLPLLRLTGDLGANPPEFVSRYTGTWTFNLLLLTLCISPLRAWTGAHWLLRLRRSLGLLTFFYALLHFGAFALFDHELEWTAMATDIYDRPFIAVGFTAFVLMLPLALTSNRWAIAHLGGRRWQELHRSIYLIAILATLHYFWLSKITAIFYPLAYAALVVLLLAWRVADRMRRGTLPAQPTVQSMPQTIRFFKQRPK